LEAVRDLEWKLVLASATTNATAGKGGKENQNGRSSPQLFHLKSDIGESKDVAAEHPEVVARLQELVKRMQNDLGVAGPAPGSRALGRVADPKPLL
jgi:hypothetical protein